MLGHRQVVFVSLQKTVPVLDAIGADDHVDRLSHRDAPIPKHAIVGGSPDREAGREHLRDRKVSEILLDPPSLMMIACALKNLKHDNVAEKNGLLRNEGAQLVSNVDGVLPE